MNVNIIGIYNHTAGVDSNLFDDVRRLQTGLSSLSDLDILFNVGEAFHINMKIYQHLQLYLIIMLTFK